MTVTNRELENRVIDTRNDHVPLMFRPTRALLPKAPVAPAGTSTPFLPPATPALGVNPSGKGGIPLALLSLVATQTPVKQQSYTNSEITISFTSDPSDKNFYAVDIWFVGYHGNSNPQLMSSGNSSPINFVCDSTGETVSVFAQTVSTTGMSAPLTFAANTAVTLSGTVTAPPPPAIAQTLIATPTGYQFSFNFITGLLTDVIANYRVYRNSSNTTTGATVIHTIPQDTNGSSSTYVVQDVIGSQNTTTFYYWVSAVNTAGLESLLTNAQSGAVAQGIWQIGTANLGDVAINNGNFEQSGTILPPPGFGYYGTQPTLAYDISTQYAGNQSLKITSAGAAGGVTPLGKINCQPGDIFYATVFTKKISGAGSAQLQITYRDLNGNFIGAGGVATSASASWIQLTVSATAPTGTVYVTAEIFANAATTIVEFDNLDVKFVRNLDKHVSDGSTYLRTPVFLGAQNLAENGNFESSTTLPVPSWIPNGIATLSYETSSPFTGKNQSLIVNASAQFGFAMSARKFSSKQGDAWRISGEVFQVSNVGTAVVLVFLDKTGTQIGTSIVATTAATGTWTFVSATGISPANCVAVQLYCDITGVSGGIGKFDFVTCTRQLTSFELTPTSTSGTPTATTGFCTQSGVSTTILVGASTWQFGDGQVSYNSGSVNPGSLGAWYVYADDPGYAGGAVTYLATATPSDVNASNGRLFFGKITTVGGGGAVSTGGGSGGGGPAGKGSLR